ncbi:DoxX family protein [Arcanobacterium hippocoleae]
MNLIRSIARPMLAAPFIISGIDAAAHPETHRERIAKLAKIFAKIGVNLPNDERADAVTRATGAAMTLAGAALAASKFPRLSSALLGMLQVPVALANNPFWESRGEQQRKDVIGFAAAAGLIGGAVIAAYDREGRPSAVWRAKNWAGDIQTSVENKLNQIGQ